MHDPQATAGATVSILSTITAVVATAMPLLQFIAIVVAIVSGCFAIAVSIKRLRGK